MYPADFVMFSIKIDYITILSNIEKICRICYTLSCSTIPTILPIIAILLVTYNEIPPAHLVGSIFLCKGTAARERQIPLCRCSANGLVDLTTTFRNFHHV